MRHSEVYIYSSYRVQGGQTSHARTHEYMNAKTRLSQQLAADWDFWMQQHQESVKSLNSSHSNRPPRFIAYTLFTLLTRSNFKTCRRRVST